jgi:hypothetical protein
MISQVPIGERMLPSLSLMVKQICLKSKRKILLADNDITKKFKYHNR